MKTIDVLPKLVSDGGGRIYSITTEADVPAGTKQLLDDLRNQYTLAYTPTKSFDGRYRRVRVDINARGYSVRHRNGYLAVPHK